MYELVDYHRPTSLGEAVDLLGDGRRVVIGGGTTIRHRHGGEPVELVDLQALGLDTIDSHGDRFRIGATTSLQAIVDHLDVPDGLRLAARAELPSTLRSLATIGGAVGAGDRESVLLATLLVHDATVETADGLTVELDAALAADPVEGRLIVAVTATPGGRFAQASTARTPADTPIVAAVGRATDDGTAIALTGVAQTPVVVDERALDGLDPPSDFRGSPEYRRHLATVLWHRVRGELS